MMEIKIVNLVLWARILVSKIFKMAENIEDYENYVELKCTWLVQLVRSLPSDHNVPSLQSFKALVLSIKKKIEISDFAKFNVSKRRLRVTK